MNRTTRLVLSMSALLLLAGVYGITQNATVSDVQPAGHALDARTTVDTSEPHMSSVELLQNASTDLQRTVDARYIQGQ